jgi:hypothetical protein
MANASSATCVRPTIARTPNISSRFQVTYALVICSGGPSPVSVPVMATAPAKPSNCVVSVW